MKKLILILALLCPALAQAQQSVALAPSLHPQFVDGTGKVLSGGFLYFFAAGTSTPQNTYADNLGTIANPNPIPLDATGAPSNGSTQVQVWLLNSSYKVCGYSSALVQQWCSDNVNSYQILTGVQNIVFGSVTSDPTGFAGELGYRSDLSCFRGFSSFWDCFATLTGIQTLTNKTFTSPIINGGTQNSPAVLTPSINGVIVANSPGTYISVGNSVIGTVASRLTKLVGGLAQTAATTDVSGSMGITVQCVSSCGQPGSSVIQQSGTVTCFFDNATTAGDYVQISVLTGGSCHDTGSTTAPASGQIIGVVTVTSILSATPLALDLYGPGIVGGQLGAASGCTTIGPLSITNNNALQTLISCPIAANALSAGSMLSATLTGIESTASGQNITFTTSVGAGTSCSSQSGAIGVANNQPWQVNISFSVLTAGAGGTANMYCSSQGAAMGFIPAGGVVGAPTISVNTTIPNTLLIQVQMSVANAGNSVTAQLLKAVIY